MKKYFPLSFIICSFLMFCGLQLSAQSLGKPVTWKNSDLLHPKELAALLNNPKARKPLIYNIGVAEDIKGAINLGAASEAKNLNKLKDKLKLVPKDSFLVIYCGCCPFDKCPNIRPALALVKQMGFSKARLLNLPVNLRTNWTSLGYPLK